MPYILDFRKTHENALENGPEGVSLCSVCIHACLQNVTTHQSPPCGTKRSRTATGRSTELTDHN